MKYKAKKTLFFVGSIENTKIERWDKVQIANSLEDMKKRKKESIFGKVVAENFPNSWKNVTHKLESLTQSKHNTWTLQEKSRTLKQELSGRQLTSWCNHWFWERLEGHQREKGPGVTFMDTQHKDTPKAALTTNSKCKYERYNSEKGVSKVPVKHLEDNQQYIYIHTYIHICIHTHTHIFKDLLICRVYNILLPCTLSCPKGCQILL